MKRIPLRRKSKTPLKKLKDKLWAACSTYIRKRDAGICFTCGRTCEGSGYHAGHFIPDAVGGLLLRYEETNIHGQCYHCNINLGGWGERYTQKMEEKYSKEHVSDLRKLIYKTTKWEEYDYLQKTEYYKSKLKEV